ncbi:MAG: pyridoxamine 5'-phosphate oxidase family protein [Ginsengibacter sp.]
MDSINKQQKENNFQNLHGSEAIKKIKELTDNAPSCFFCTDIESGKPFITRPMSLQQLDDDGNLWFLSANDSHKNFEIKTDSKVQLLFQGSDYSDFLNLYGTATISEDKEKIKELWKPILKTWFTEGVDDPGISVIKVVPEEGYYWDTKHNMAIGLIKRVAGAIVGKTMDDSIEGNLSV